MRVLDLPLDTDVDELIVATSISRVVGTNGKRGRKQRGPVRHLVNGSFGREYRGSGRIGDDDLYDMANGPSFRVPFCHHEWDDHQAEALCTRLGAMQQALANAHVNVRRCRWCNLNELPAGHSAFCSDECSRRWTLRHQSEQYAARKDVQCSTQTQTKETAA